MNQAEGKIKIQIFLIYRARGISLLYIIMLLFVEEVFWQRRSMSEEVVGDNVNEKKRTKNKGQFR